MACRLCVLAAIDASTGLTDGAGGASLTRRSLSIAMAATAAPLLCTLSNADHLATYQMAAGRVSELFRYDDTARLK